MWLNVNGFAAFGPPLKEHLDVTNLDCIKDLSQSEIQEFVDILKEEEPSIHLRLRTRFKRQFYDLVTKYSPYIKNKQSEPSKCQPRSTITWFTVRSKGTRCLFKIFRNPKKFISIMCN